MVDYIESLEKQNEALQEKVEELQTIVDLYCDKEIIKKDYSVIPWWKFWIRNDPNLQFYLKHKRCGNYGYSTNIKRINLHKLLKYVVTKKQEIWYSTKDQDNGNFVKSPVVKSFYRGYHYPVFDCDDKREWFSLTTHLDNMDMGYAIFNSSVNNKWIIVDNPQRSFKKAHEFVCQIKAGDEKYKVMNREDNAFFLRITRKPESQFDVSFDGFSMTKPAIIGPYSYFIEFIKKLSEYYEKSREYKILSENIKLS